MEIIINCSLRCHTINAECVFAHIDVFSQCTAYSPHSVSVVY